MNQKINISSYFDSGNIRVLSTESATNIQLEINKDSHADFYQWFYFRLQSTAGIEHRMHIVNASGASYAKGWEGYQAVASYDRKTWFRVNSCYQDGTLIIEHTPEYTSTYYAYFAPYSFERHLDLLQRIQLSPLCTLEHLGESVDGRDMTLAVIEDSSGESYDKKPKKSIWVIARQHPGESMAEWFIEGLLDRILDQDDPISRKLLQSCTFYVIANMNPDGSVRGNLRTNAAGANLNREWLEPSMDNSPEVFLVREKMLKTGVDLFLDIHGDEDIPYNFLVGSEGVPSFDQRIEQMQDCFKTAFLNASPDFQTAEGYPEDEQGSANLSMACTWVGERFHCLSFTLEMPFKDNQALPDPIFGWSAERSYHFGESILIPVLETTTKF